MRKGIYKNIIREGYAIDDSTPIDFFDRSKLVDDFISYLKQSVKMPPINQEIIYRIDRNTKVIIQHVNTSKSIYVGDEKKYFKVMLVYKDKILNKNRMFYGVSDINKDREFTPEEVFNNILNTSYVGLFRSNFYENYVYGLNRIDSELHESFNIEPIVVKLDVEVDEDELCDMINDFNSNNIRAEYSSKYDTLKLYANSEDAKYALCDYVCYYYSGGEPYCYDVLEIYPKLKRYYKDCEGAFNANYITV